MQSEHVAKNRHSKKTTLKHPSAPTKFMIFTTVFSGRFQDVTVFQKSLSFEGGPNTLSLYYGAFAPYCVMRRHVWYANSCFAQVVVSALLGLSVRSWTPATFSDPSKGSSFVCLRDTRRLSCSNAFNPKP